MDLISIAGKEFTSHRIIFLSFFISSLGLSLFWYILIILVFSSLFCTNQCGAEDNFFSLKDSSRSQHFGIVPQVLSRVYKPKIGPGEAEEITSKVWTSWKRLLRLVETRWSLSFLCNNRNFHEIQQPKSEELERITKELSFEQERYQ